MPGSVLTPDFPVAADTAVTLGEARNNAATALTVDAASGDATLTVTATSSFPSTGAISLESEIIYYTGKTATTFTGCSRGQDNTTAAAHVSTTPVEGRIIAQHIQAHSLAIRELEGKVGIGADTPATGDFFKGTGTGTSGWSALSSGDVTGALGFSPINKAGDTGIGALTLTGALTLSLASGNSLVVDTNTLVVDASNDRVGIGTATPDSLLHTVKAFLNPASGGQHLIFAQLTAKGTSAVTETTRALRVSVADNTLVADKTITGITNAVPAVVTSAIHGLANGDKIAIYGCTDTDYNAAWTVANVTTNTFEINNGSALGAASDGTATNRPMMTGVAILVAPKVARGGLTGTAQDADDANGVTVINATGVATAKATDGFYVADSPIITASAWLTGFAVGAKCDTPFKAANSIYVAGLDFTSAIFEGSASAVALPAGRLGPDGQLAVGATAMSLTNSGSGVYVKTTDSSNPELKLEGTGNSSTAFLELYGKTSGAAVVRVQTRADEGGAGWFGTLTNHSLLFTTNNTERFRINAGTLALQFVDAVNMTFGATTGTKIGTATTEKIGFYNVTPVVQPAAYTPTNVGADRAYNANATTIDELADVLGTLVADLQSVGLIG